MFIDSETYRVVSVELRAKGLAAAAGLAASAVASSSTSAAAPVSTWGARPQQQQQQQRLPSSSSSSMQLQQQLQQQQPTGTNLPLATLCQVGDVVLVHDERALSFPPLDGGGGGGRGGGGQRSDPAGRPRVPVEPLRRHDCGPRGEVGDLRLQARDAEDAAEAGRAGREESGDGGGRAAAAVSRLRGPARFVRLGGVCGGLRAGRGAREGHARRQACRGQGGEEGEAAGGRDGEREQPELAFEWRRRKLARSLELDDSEREQQRRCCRRCCCSGCSCSRSVAALSALELPAGLGWRQIDDPGGARLGN